MNLKRLVSYGNAGAVIDVAYRVQLENFSVLENFSAISGGVVVALL